MRTSADVARCGLYHIILAWQSGESHASLLGTAMQTQDLTARAERIAVLLKRRRETVAVAESSTGGLISAALLGVGGASSYFVGGAVIYTQTARRALLDIPDSAMAGLRPSTEAYALLLGRTARTRMGAAWALAETGATGPTGNSYGDAAGHS
jgi:nicotinamide-nucleotide amidase